MEKPTDSALDKPAEPMPLSPLWIVVKQILRVAGITALVGGLIFGVGFTSIVTVVPPPDWFPDFPGRQIIYAFGSFFLFGAYLGAVAGAICGLISGCMRAWRLQQTPPSYRQPSEVNIPPPAAPRAAENPPPQE